MGQDNCRFGKIVFLWAWQTKRGSSKILYCVTKIIFLAEDFKTQGKRGRSIEISISPKNINPTYLKDMSFSIQ